MHGIKGVSMTNTSTLTLDGVSFQLPDGSLLFSDLDETFDTRHTGLVGRNGVGKSLLARLLAGHLQPSSGSVRRQGRVRYLAQQLEPADYPTVADLAGVRPWLEALARIEAGSLDAADYECLGERWDIRQRLADALAAEGLGHLRADTPSERLSGGECMRVALLGAFLDDADFLILDEPSNPLDGPARALLRARLAAWDGGLLLVSHDRELLEGMQRIVELSTLGLRSYGGGYSFYAQSREEAREAAERRLDQRRLERKRQTLAMREQQQRQERRQASGRREGKTANQAKILLGGFRERSEVSAGKLRNAHQAERERLDREVREAAREVEEASPLLLDSPDAELAAQRRIVELKGAVLPHLRGPLREIDLLLSGPRRLALVGPNCSGKSTLLRLLAGQRAPLAGTCAVTVGAAYLDQRLSVLDHGRGVLEQLLEVNRSRGESWLRTRLAQLGLPAERLAQPCATLSGGERLKAALALVLYADRPAQLLLLDEPDNHLDLAARQALESMLGQYRGPCWWCPTTRCFSGDWRWMANCGLLPRVGAWRTDELAIRRDLQEADSAVAETDGEEFVADCQAQRYGVCRAVAPATFAAGEVAYLDLTIDQRQCDPLSAGQRREGADLGGQGRAPERAAALQVVAGQALGTVGVMRRVVDLGVEQQAIAQQAAVQVVEVLRVALQA
ncbi:ABC transporter ATPase [Pseudomonas aeruginosa]|nr:ABC transporter ATPase [Pseudomonas aeruginosa]